MYPPDLAGKLPERRSLRLTEIQVFILGVNFNEGKLVKVWQSSLSSSHSISRDLVINDEQP